MKRQSSTIKGDGVLEFTYEEYQKQRQIKKNKLLTFKKFSEILPDIPYLGNTLKTGADFMRENIENKSEFKASFVDNKKVINNTYFFLSANNYYGELFEKLFSILEMKELSERYNYDVHKLNVSIEELYYEESKEFEDAITIEFLDDTYTNDRTGTFSTGMVYIAFEKKFEQINFEDDNVYSVFETTSTGMNHHQSRRNYIEIAALICNLLGNRKLLK